MQLKMLTAACWWALNY